MKNRYVYEAKCNRSYFQADSSGSSMHLKFWPSCVKNPCVFNTFRAFLLYWISEGESSLKWKNTVQSCKSMHKRIKNQISLFWKGQESHILHTFCLLANYWSPFCLLDKSYKIQKTYFRIAWIKCKVSTNLNIPSNISLLATWLCYLTYCFWIFI